MKWTPARIILVVGTIIGLSALGILMYSISNDPIDDIIPLAREIIKLA